MFQKQRVMCRPCWIEINIIHTNWNIYRILALYTVFWFWKSFFAQWFQRNTSVLTIWDHCYFRFTLLTKHTDQSIEIKFVWFFFCYYYYYYYLLLRTRVDLYWNVVTWNRVGRHWVYKRCSFVFLFFLYTYFTFLLYLFLYGFRHGQTYTTSVNIIRLAFDSDSIIQ